MTRDANNRGEIRLLFETKLPMETTNRVEARRKFKARQERTDDVC